ncbi:antibiotic biosynthesis monooxygenase family protein [Kineosporia babensis]|uniref:Antibiotic biosynthesis monooxygenase n=1 Tax=Kineosporia babensis TaxID=499548 RepID=A0A9X1NLF1_9ACTN|nr:antibiotic biosynthesis monooxygenase [Kineosporia babensis]MCD5315694.1 antibiotic biosynthesis monooxygenase [Kineosporia babensis]
MPFIDPEDGYLTVLNLFKTDAPERVDRLVREMSSIVDKAAFPGWISSTVHRGQDKMGTANFIQWRGKQDLESRYQGDEFKHRTVPVFHEITTYVRLMQTEVAASQRHPSLGGVTELSPDRDDYTVIEVLGVEPARQGELIETLRTSQDWLVDVPGYRSQTVLRGIRARGIGEGSGDLQAAGQDNDFVVVYSQWADKASFDRHHRSVPGEFEIARRRNQQRRKALTTSVEWNTYRVVHSRSAEQPVAS